jgi:hypothetical protein
MEAAIMKIYQKFAMVIVVFLPAAAMADSFLTDTNVKYRGDTDARRICRAIVEDDARDLKQSLKLYRSTLLYRYSSDLISNAVSGNFSCNGNELLTFAREVGSQNITRYLQGGSVEMEELVSTID